MATPHKCPVCNGFCQIYYPARLVNSSNAAVVYHAEHYEDCPACKATGIVWEPEVYPYVASAEG